MARRKKKKSLAHFLRKYFIKKKGEKGVKEKIVESNVEVEVSESETVETEETTSANQPQEEESVINHKDDSTVSNYGSFKIEDIPLRMHNEKRNMNTIVTIPNRRGSLFNDGEKKIDFVLVYEEKKSQKDQKIEEWRRRFESNLRNSGLEMEEEVMEGEKNIHFIKLSTPWHLLIDYAEELCFRAPLQVNPNTTMNWSERILKKLHILNICSISIPNQPPDYYTCAFKKSKMEKFLGIENREEFFTSVQRSQVVNEILKNIVYGKRSKGEVGIERLVEENVYTDAFPLHDGPYELPEEYQPKDLNRRQVLYEYWAKWGRWYKYQPLDHIREYFGEKIAIYFAWLGFYTAWLLPASVVGLLVFLYGVCTIQSDLPSNEICQSGKQYLMCPLCEERQPGCKYWHLSDTCIFVRIGYLFDQAGTVFYSIFMAFWAIAFLEYWKRKSISLAHHWDCMDFEEVERPRPEFAAKAPLILRNAITGTKEPAFPTSKRFIRLTAGVGVLLFMVSLVVVFVFAVIVYRLLVSIPLFQYKPFRGMAPVIASLSGACINLLFIMIMGRIYENIALKLTEWEMHRTQTEFENNLTFKVFLFQFVNFYSSIFYIAFFKGRFSGYPGHYHKIFNLRLETCGNNGCFIELAQQLAVIMIGKQIINNAQEIIIPKIKTWWHRRKTKLCKQNRTENTSQWNQDYRMIKCEGLFQEYLEMVLQFGFITIFVVAFPLAPLFALLNNWVEIRLDAHKFVCETRRSVAERAQNIGIWYTILQVLAHLAVISNAFLIAFTSEFLPKLLYSYNNNSLHGFVNYTLAYSPEGSMNTTCRYTAYRDPKGNLTTFYWELLAIRLGFVIVFEHVVFGICRLIDVLVPDIPESLEIKIKRERYLAKQALTESEAILNITMGEDEEECKL
ncbi:anoctamin-7-like isoform X2 [Centruroides sculpturatus]|uniref:anoctamin-7-like isoform X2 n=1 Tax=Centruroides sculpturatus TaxID=218467 RepID=UPI000C6ED084|nr:anoctamin-7-like isoform X2 [Centruroides sculpturatus]